MEALEARLELYRDENKEVGRELMASGLKFKSPVERVKLCQWLKKLSELRSDKLSQIKMKHEYLQYLRVSVQGDYKILTKPFSSQPPEGLVPLAECIANKTADSIPDVPRAGILQPVLMHKSDENRAFMCVKRTNDNGILCYMACSPDASVAR